MEMFCRAQVSGKSICSSLSFVVSEKHYTWEKKKKGTNKTKNKKKKHLCCCYHITTLVMKLHNTNSKEIQTLHRDGDSFFICQIVKRILTDLTPFSLF